MIIINVGFLAKIIGGCMITAAILNLSFNFIVVITAIIVVILYFDLLTLLILDFNFNLTLGVIHDHIS